MPILYSYAWLRRQLAVCAATACACWLTGAALLLNTPTAQAQAPAWTEVTVGSSMQPTGTRNTAAVATDASGNVFVTGSFSGQVYFGSTLLTSRGDYDLFVAKYVPSTSTWAWAQSGGGTQSDAGRGIAVSGTSVYVTGSINTNAANTQAVLFGGTSTPGTIPVNGAASATSSDLLLVKYTDNGPSATLNWTQVGGGRGFDEGYGVAVSGPNVYVAGTITNTSADFYSVLFGGTGTTAGTAKQYGATQAISQDVLLAKYTDNGSTATLGWTQVGGGTEEDSGFGIAVSGACVYVVGYSNNNTTNTRGVLFGGTGTTLGTVSVNGASGTASPDVLLAKYIDNGPSATLGWTQVGGGTNYDYGRGVAVSGTSVYITGDIYNNTANTQGVLFGGTGTTLGTVSVNGASGTASDDALLAKYTDNGASATLGWTQVGGGTNSDYGNGVAVSGTSVYVAGSISNNTANTQGVLFGGTGTTPGTVSVGGASGTTSADVLLAKYTDNGASATLSWTQVGGGTSYDYGNGVAVSGTNVLLGGYITPSARFGSITIANPVGSSVPMLARLVDTSLTPLPVRAGAVSNELTIFPNPASGRAATLCGAAPNQGVQVLDAQGRLVSTATASVLGRAELVLPAALPAGLYIVRVGQRAVRLSVE